jgi:hypothetical protein
MSRTKLGMRTRTVGESRAAKFRARHLDGWGASFWAARRAQGGARAALCSAGRARLPPQARRSTGRPSASLVPAVGASERAASSRRSAWEVCPHCFGRAERGPAAARAGVRQPPGSGVPMPARRSGPAARRPRTWWRRRGRSTGAAPHCGTSALLLAHFVSQAGPARARGASPGIRVPMPARPGGRSRGGAAGQAHGPLLCRWPLCRGSHPHALGVSAASLRV